MHRRIVAALAAVAAVAALAGEGRAPVKRLSAEQIVAKNAAARGGLEAWRKVETMMWFGQIVTTHAPTPSMRFVLAQKRPNKMRFEIDAIQDRSLRVFDGLRGWKMRPSHGRPEVQPYTIDEVRFEQSGPGIDGPLIDYAQKGSSVSLAGLDEIEKRKAYHLIVRTATGENQHVWVDAETFLEIRYDRPAGGPAAPSGGGAEPAAGPAAAAGGARAAAGRTVSVVYRDYKTTDGLKIPSIIETGVAPGTQPDRMVIERVVVNPPLNEQTFNMPGQQRTRNRMPFPSHRPPGAAGGVLPPMFSKPPSPVTNTAPPSTQPASPVASPPVTPPSAPGSEPGTSDDSGARPQ
jgi:outer membrane lipoprotein-sorting protein